MIFGDKEKFAVECLKSRSSDDIYFIQSRIFLENREIGDFDELAVSGVILLAINSFLQSSGARIISSKNDEVDFLFLYASMYGDNWRIGMRENFRDRFSMHDLFEAAIADQGFIIFLFTSINESKILIGNRNGNYCHSVKVSENEVNSILKEVVAWIKIPIER